MYALDKIAWKRIKLLKKDLLQCFAVIQLEKMNINLDTGKFSKLYF